MLLSAVYVLVVAQSSSEVPEGLMNNLVFIFLTQTGGSFLKDNSVIDFMIETARRPVNPTSNNL